MKIKCEVCGKLFSNDRGKARIPRFCSMDCRIKSKDNFIKCPECGIVFRTTNGSKRPRKFCSKKCSNRFNQPKDPNKKSTFICKWCGKEFIEWAYRKPSICSDQCRSEYGASIRAKQLYKGGASHRGMNWKSQARLARKRDNYTCAVRGRHGYVDNFKVCVHHIIPYREFDGDYENANDLSNLISLCPQCHPKVEAGVIDIFYI